MHYVLETGLHSFKCRPAATNLQQQPGIYYNFKHHYVHKLRMRPGKNMPGLPYLTYELF